MRRRLTVRQGKRLSESIWLRRFLLSATVWVLMPVVAAPAQLPSDLQEAVEHIRSFDGIEGDVTAVAFSPDGRYVIAGSQFGAVTLWEVVTRREVHTLEKSPGTGITPVIPPRIVLDPVKAVAFAPDGRTALLAWPGKVVVWEVATGRTVRTFPINGSTTGLGVVAFSPDGRYVISGTLLGAVKVWEVATGREIRKLEAPYGAETLQIFARPPPSNRSKR